MPRRRKIGRPRFRRRMMRHDGRGLLKRPRIWRKMTARCDQINTKLTPEEGKTARAMARKAGMTPGSLIRWLLAKHFAEGLPPADFDQEELPEADAPASQPAPETPDSEV